MSVEFDAQSSGSAYVGGPSSLTIPHTITDQGSGRLLLVAVAINGSTVSSVTFSGDSMTSKASLNSGRFRLFFLFNPAVGTHNIVITAAASAYVIVGSAASYTGADVSSAAACFSTEHDTAGASGSVSYAESSLVGERVFSAILSERTNSGAGTSPAIDSTAGPTQIERAVIQATRNGYTYPTGKAGISDAPGASSVTMAWNYYSSDNATYLISFAIHAAPSPKARTIDFISNTYQSRAAGRTVILDALGRDLPPEQLPQDKWIRVDGPAFVSSYRYASNIDDPSVYYSESVSLGDSLSIKTDRQSLLESLLGRLGGRSI